MYAVCFFLIFAWTCFRYYTECCTHVDFRRYYLCRRQAMPRST